MMKIIEGGCYHLGGGRRSPVVSRAYRIVMLVIWIVFVVLALACLAFWN
jgi:hypothetical protein